MIIHHIKNNLSIRETAQVLNVSKSTVHHIWCKYQENGHVKDKRRNGRPKKLDRRDESQVIRDLTKNPTLPLRVLVNQFYLNKSPNNQISSMTMSRILLKNNLISRKLSIKWKISPTMPKKD